MSSPNPRAPAGRFGTVLAAAALFTAAMLVVVAPRTAWACAACGNPSLPQLPTGTGTRDSGVVSMQTSLQGGGLWVSHPAGCTDLADCDAIPVQPAHTHELFALPVELRVSAQWAATSVVGIEAELPLRLVHLRASYESPDGTPYEPIDAGVTNCASCNRIEFIFGLLRDY